MSRSRHASLAALATLVAGCGALRPGRDVFVDDDRAWLPTLRVVVDAEQTNGEGGAGGAFVGELAYADGQSSAGAASYRVYDALAAAALPWSDRGFYGGMLIGLDFLVLEVESPVARESSGSLGPVVGVDLGHDLNVAELYASGRAAALLPATVSLRGEIGLRAEVCSGFGLFGAYRWWDLEREREDVSFVTDYHVDLEGWVLGMELRF